MNRKPIAGFISRAARSAAPVAAVATSLAAPLAQAASGDLDPAFADHGRLNQVPGADGAAFAIESLNDGRLFVGGGDLDYNWQCWYGWYDCDLEASGFATGLGADGSIDPTSPSYHADQFEALAVARQADGKVVMAGHRGTGGYNFDRSFVVLRLAADGSVDDSFASNGEFVLDDDLGAANSTAGALALDPDGHIVVAGTRFHGVNELIVLRLTAQGELDPGFGDGGIHASPVGVDNYNVHLARTGAGAYRIAYGAADGCALAGLTAAGAPDAAFGAGGTAEIPSPSGQPVDCQALALDAEGRLLIAGSADGNGFAARLLADGVPDASFDADAALADDWGSATAIAAAADGRVLVSGSGLRGASVMRLLATGALDAAFGDGGRTWIDLATESAASPNVYSLSLDAAGGILAAGGDGLSDKPFVVRLLGDGGGASAGILSAVAGSASASETDGRAVLHVRRSGGSAGNVSVEFHTRSDGDAVAGDDYTEVSGTLHWADGETTEREIEIPIRRDDENPEAYEYFGVVLENALGGAALGARSASIEVQPDGAPAGQIAIYDTTTVVIEGGTAVVALSRDYYTEGEVSVTVTPSSGTATAGADFADDSYTVTWGPGDADVQYVRIPIVDDSTREESESFTVRLSDPTGGAILGARVEDTVTIGRDIATTSGRGDGGGGASGFLSLFLLGCLQFFRGARRRV